MRFLQTTIAASTVAVCVATAWACGHGQAKQHSKASADQAGGAAPTLPAADAAGVGTIVLPGATMTGGSSQPAAAAAAAAPARVRRLTATEIVNAANQVFLGTASVPLSLVADAAQKGAFDNQIDAQGITTPFLDSLQAAAETVAAAAVKDVDKLTGCTVAKAGEQACLQSLFDTVGRRAYRRPLTSDEQTRLAGLFKTTRTGDNYQTSIATVVEAMIQSPQFLFRFETGGSGDGIVQLTPYELASALSFFLWRSAPDDILLDAAKDNQLSTPAQITSQTTRMLADSRAQDGVWNFFAQWMTIATPAGLSAARLTAFPSFTPAVAQAAVNDFRSFIQQQILGPSPSYKQLFTSNKTIISSELASIYNVPASPSAPGALDASNRAGILTSVAFLASLSNSVEFSPVHFGVFTASQVFCNNIPPPPPGIPPVAAASKSTTARQRFSVHATSPNCAGCHSRFEPMGWAYEQFNAIGGFSPMDNGTALDGSGKIAGTDVDGSFKGPVQLADLIAKSQTAAACFTAKWLEYATGRVVSQPANQLSVDKTLIAAGTQQLMTQDSVAQLIVSIAKSDAFLKRDRRNFNATTP